MRLERVTRFKRKPVKIGAAPGTLIHIGEKRTEQVRLSLVNYDDATITESEATDIEEAISLCDGPRKTWLNIDGLHDTQCIEKVGRRFNIHSLILEDILNTTQRPKWDNFRDYIYVVLHMFRLENSGSEDTKNSEVSDNFSNTGVLSEQISLIITPNVLISFQESQGDVFAPIKERLRKGQGRIRESSIDYLAYALIDAIVDHYFVVLEKYGNEIEELEEETLSKENPDILKRLHMLKGDITTLRKQVWPLREVILGLSKEELPLISETTSLFLRDVYDHTIQVIETVESFRDSLTGLLELYLTTVSNRMNEVMKTLTIMASIFIPLTFIAGIYGMNFKYMPELEWRWSYGVIWIVIILLGLAMVLYFKKKKWF